MFSNILKLKIHYKLNSSKALCDRIEAEHSGITF